MNDKKPQTDAEWTIHSLNIHGLFFERWCTEQIFLNNEWNLRTINVPIQYPPEWAVRESRIEQSELDIKADYKRDSNSITLIIECKKNNPAYTEWILFVKDKRLHTLQYRVHCVTNIPNESSGRIPLWNPLTSLGALNIQYPVASDGRETKGNYRKNQSGDKTKTDTNAINAASKQVVIGVKATVPDEVRLSVSLANKAGSKMPWQMKYIIPVIVTTAKLYTCEFNSTDVDENIGEIPFDKVKLKTVKSLIYEYPIPTHLQVEPANWYSPDVNENFRRMPIVIVQSSYFNTFLNEIKGII